MSCAANTPTAAAMMRGFNREAAGQAPAGAECVACMLARKSGAARDAQQVTGHHLRKISSEMHMVVTNPISISMTGSLVGKPLARADTGLLTGGNGGLGRGNAFGDQAALRS